MFVLVFFEGKVSCVRQECQNVRPACPFGVALDNPQSLVLFCLVVSFLPKTGPALGELELFLLIQKYGLKQPATTAINSQNQNLALTQTHSFSTGGAK